MRTALVIPGALLLTIGTFVVVPAASPPKTISYQGYLKDGAGTPVTTATSIRFSLYSSNPSRNNPVWMEARSVTPANGVYSVQLGSETPITALFDVAYYLGVQVGRDVEMALQPLSSVPYAFVAGLADGGVTTAKLADSAVTGAKLAAGSVQTATLQDGAVSGTKLADGSVTSAKLAAPLALSYTSTTTATIYAESIGNSGIFAVANSSGFPAIEAKQNGTGAVLIGYSGPSTVFSVFNDGSIYSGGSLHLLATGTSAGIITAGGNRMIHSYGSNNFFAGANAGNLTMTGSSNTATGVQALTSNTAGSGNTATGRSALLNNTILNGNTATGYMALAQQSYNNGGTAWNSFNTAIGYQALSANNPTSPFNGVENTAVGGMALMNNTTGQYNTAVGFMALTTNTFGYANTATGYSALLNNTAGSANTAYGVQALNNNTTAGGNTAVGKLALAQQSYSNSGTAWDTFNTAVGYQALNANNPTSLFNGSYNTAVGGKALLNSNTGNNNAAFGFEALNANISGTFNTATGGSALSDNKTGSSNTANGFAALHSNSNGSSNTAVGYYALYNDTGNFNTGIGYAADVVASNLTNATVIGSNARVNASNMVRIGNTSVTVIEGQVAWSNPSDVRLKKDVTDVSHGLDFITALRPVEFRMKEGNGRKDFGFIAQDIEALLGTEYNVLGTGGDKERTLTLRYTDFIAPMVKAMQEQSVVIEAQKVQIKTIEERLVRIEALLAVK
jgi:hypothetical protein